MSAFLRFDGGQERDPAIAAWFEERTDELGAIARHWFDKMKACGDDVLEVLHDGCPTALVEDAGFAYVNAFTAHVNVGFFRGAEFTDPAGLLEGTGRFMRHVKLRPGHEIGSTALERLIDHSYVDIKARLSAD